MKKIILFLLPLVLFGEWAFSQNVSNNPSFLKTRRYKVYFGQNYLECVYVDKTQLNNLIGAGPYKFYWIYDSDNNTNISSSEEYILVNAINAYTPTNTGEVPNVPNFDNRPNGGWVSENALYGSFDNSTINDKNAIIFNRRHATFPSNYINVIIKSTTSGRYCTGNIYHLLTSEVGSLQDANGISRNNFDVDRINVAPNHNNITIAAYNTNGNSTSYTPATSTSADNHQFFQNFNAASISQNITSSNVININQPNYSDINYSGCTTCSYTNTEDNGDGTVTIKITGLQGGGGRYELYVPYNANNPYSGEMITLPMTKSQGTLSQIPNYVYYAQNITGVSMYVRLKKNIQNEIRIRSAFNYDDKFGNIFIEGLGGQKWDFDTQHLSNVTNTGYKSIYITPTNTSTTNCSSLADKQVLGKWNVTQDQLIVRNFGGQLWLTQSLNANSACPLNGSTDGFLPRPGRFLTDAYNGVTMTYTAMTPAALAACFQGGTSDVYNVTGFTTPTGYTYNGTCTDNSPFYKATIGNTCSSLADKQVLGKWNVTQDQLIVRNFGGQLWLTQSLNANSACPLNGSTDGFLPRPGRFLTDAYNGVTMTYTAMTPAALAACFQGGTSDVYNVTGFTTPTGYTYNGTCTDNSPFYKATIGNTCSSLADKQVLGKWNVTQDQLIVRNFGGQLWLTQSLNANSACPLNGSTDGFLPRPGRFLTDAYNGVTMTYTAMTPAALAACFQGGTSDVYNVTGFTTPTGYTYNGTCTDNSPFYKKILGARIGTEEISNLSTESTSVLEIIPNPIGNELKFSVSLPETSRLSTRLIDMNGAVLIKKDIEGKAGKNSFTLDVTSQKAAMYILEVQTGNTRLTQKVVKE